MIQIHFNMISYFDELAPRKNTFRKYRSERFADDRNCGRGWASHFETHEVIIQNIRFHQGNHFEIVPSGSSGGKMVL